MVSQATSEHQPYPEDPYSELPDLSESGPMTGAARPDLMDKGAHSRLPTLVLPPHDLDGLRGSIVYRASSSHLQIITDRHIAKVLYASALVDALRQSDSKGKRLTDAEIRRKANEQTRRYADELHHQLSLGGIHGHKYFAEKVRKGKEELAKHQQEVARQNRDEERYKRIVTLLTVLKWIGNVNVALIPMAGLWFSPASALVRGAIGPLGGLVYSTCINYSENLEVIKRDWKGFVIAESLDILEAGASSQMAEDGVIGAKNYLSGKLRSGGGRLARFVLKHPGHMIPSWLTTHVMITSLIFAYDAPPAPPKAIEFVRYNTPKDKTKEWFSRKTS